MHPPAPMPATADASLRVEYRREPLEDLLGAPGTLAVFGFGDDAPPAHPDPRYVHVALPVLGTPPFEVWRVDAEVRHGRLDGTAWSEGGSLQFGALHVDDDGDAEAATRRAYQRLHAWLAGSSHPHPLRIWNYLDAITLGDGDDERYRRFCVGRAQGIGRDLAPGELPAATAIGHPRATGRLQLYWLAAAAPGIPLENPRQLQAWRYPRQYGPQPPGFSRALLPPSPRMPLLISGTAAIVGHASRHGDSLDTQFDEVLANLDSLVAAARRLRPALPTLPSRQTRLKAYARDAQDLADIDALLAQRFPDVPRVVLHGHVCRRELAVEIDGVHG